MAKKKEEVPECCKGCMKWVEFGKECHVYWDLKKHCTMFVEEGEVSALWNESAAMGNQGLRK